MKNSILLSCLLLIGLMACTKDPDRKETARTPVAPKSFDILSASGLTRYFGVLPNTTWQDLDTFYANGVEKYRDLPQLHNFKCAAIDCMVKFYGLTDDPSDKATERTAYYAQEMAGLINCSPESLYPMLVRLKGHWEPAKIANVASKGYDNSLRVFNALDKNSTTYATRAKGMEDLRSLFETRH